MKKASLVSKIFLFLMLMDTIYKVIAIIWTKIEIMTQGKKNEDPKVELRDTLICLAASGIGAAAITDRVYKNK
jgi:hypothetical protein